MASVERRKFFFFEHQAVEQAVLDRRPARKAESPAVSPLKTSTMSELKSNASPSATTWSGTACIARNSLTPFDDIGQLADFVLAFVGRTLRGGGKDAEAENIDEVEAVHTAAIHPVDGARGNLPCCFERFVRHAERPAKSLAVPAGITPQGDIQPLAFMELTT